MSARAEAKAKLRPWSRKDEDAMAARIRATAARPHRPRLYHLNGEAFVVTPKVKHITWQEARRAAKAALTRLHFPRHWGYSKPYEGAAP